MTTFREVASNRSSVLELTNGSRVAVIGGGPAGSFFSYFLLEIARRIDLEIQLDIYEYKDFSSIGPKGCNHCGGIISESLVQLLATEGINLPSFVVRRSLDSYVLHTDVGTVWIGTPDSEKKIAAVYRGGGPLRSLEGWESFDGHILELARTKGANVIQSKVERLSIDDEGRPRVEARGLPAAVYDLVVGAVGINSATVELFEALKIGYDIPKTTKTYICEIQLSEEIIKQYIGSAVHVFLVSIPRLEFAALIPKGTYATLCLMGEEIDKATVKEFLNNLEVRSCFPPGWSPVDAACLCLPKINIGAVGNPFGDRFALIGDCGVTRLFKDGIGAAYRTAKACAVTAIFSGISAKDFQKHYLDVCKALAFDNQLGRIVFSVVTIARKLRFLRKGILRMVQKEQDGNGNSKEMSTVLWDTFTGSASYRDIFTRALRPSFLWHLTGATLESMLSPHYKGDVHD